MGWCLRAVSRGGRANAHERGERILLLITSSVCTLLSLFHMLFVPDPPPLGVAAPLAETLLNLAFFVLLMTGLRVPRLAMRCFVVIQGMAILVLDILQRSNSRAAVWPLFVLLADLSLVLRLGKRFATSMIVAVTMWIVLSSAEDNWRFGMWDLPGTDPQWLRQERISKRYICDKPPCPALHLAALQDMILSLTILLLDFIATRGFAYQVEREQSAMLRTIDTVEAIAQLLAGYDVDTVAERLREAEGSLPPAMHAALHSLEQNLRTYRPYLPGALFEDRTDAPQPPASSAPGSGSGEAAVVFTDIRASTSIWESAADDMRKAMQTHNAVMRRAIAANRGYEVKTIGDAFMVAFEGSIAAVNFGLDVQEDLLSAEWPPGLLDLPLCRRSGDWGGLTVRIGINYGPVSVETNELTGRADYFGHTVNVAARLESVCLPGAVALPDEVWREVQPFCSDAVAGPEVDLALKGVSERATLRNVWPGTLVGRMHHPLALGHAGMTPTSSTMSLGVGHSSRLAFQATEGTVGVLTVGLGDDAAAIVGSLEATLPLLEQSGGTLVTVMGPHLVVGWNLTRRVGSHVESAVHFAERMLRASGLGHLRMGMASGDLWHGDVGTSTQRFVTVSGAAVESCFKAWQLARGTEKRCLYTADANRPVPKCALRRLASSDPSTAVYDLDPN